MKHLITFVLCTLAASVELNAQYSSENLKLDASSATPGSKYRYEKLQLYPIRANSTFISYHKGIAKYVTLKDALESKRVVISEKSDAGTVNSLFIENISRDTIIVLSGEVIQGGKQDRVIAQDFVLYPKSGKKDVSVFCVEHGRWNTRRGDTSFNVYYSISSNEVRKAATVKKDQLEVWDKVAETNQKNKTTTSTGTLAALKTSEALNAGVKRYVDHFQELLSSEADVIGVVAVSGNTILGCDMFASHDIFTKYLSNLLNSYATEAITSGKEPEVSYQKVKQYLNSLIADESRQEMEIERKGTMLKDGEKKIHISAFD
jgi:hypothetical protein